LIEIPKQDTIFFVSDLHLSKHTPQTLKVFKHWVQTVSGQNSWIFLLGDIFETWLGDDYIDLVSLQFIETIKNARDVGTKIYFMHGNRDFLVGEALGKLAKFEILHDPALLTVNQQIILITHGDQLCVDDKAYQKFRLQSRQQLWQKNFLALPIEQRIKTAEAMRSESQIHKTNSPLNIMDANPKAVEDSFQGKWPNGKSVGKCDVILHGHTHRCAIHRNLNEPVAEKPICHTGELQKGLRIVLPDWNYDYPEKNHPQGGFLEVSGEGKYNLHVFN
jgi:UDP-2,3-diacylglucosamine hydrolase